MKKYLIILLSVLSLAPVVTTARVAPPQGDALLPMPTQQEMKEIQKFLDTLSPEELDELAKIGEEIIETAQAEADHSFQTCHHLHQ